MSLINFDATKVAPQTARAAWPKGKYRVHLTQSEIKDVGAKGSGNKGIFLGAKAIGAPSETELPQTTIMWNINFMNQNETAQRIGREELSSICHATKVLQLKDTQNLHGRDFVIDVDTEFVQAKNENGTLKVENGQPVGTTYNRVKGYYNADGTAIVAGINAAATPSNAPKPDWAVAMEAAPEVAAPPVPVQPVAPSAPPVVGAAPVVAPPTTTPTEKLYYVANTTGYLAEQPINLIAIKAMNLVMAEIKVCEAGSTEWVAGDKAFPPWLMGK